MHSQTKVDAACSRAVFDRVDLILHAEELACERFVSGAEHQLLPLLLSFLQSSSSFLPKMEKSTGATTEIHHSSDATILHISGDFAVVNHGTELDQEDMARMGKDQVFKVWPYLRISKLVLILFSVSSVTIQYSHFP